MKKVILNKGYGGFSLSEKAYRLYAKKKNIDLFIYEMAIPKLKGFVHSKVVYSKVDKTDSIFVVYATKDYGEKTDKINPEDILKLDGENREDPILIEVVEQLGEEANTLVSKLEVVQIPDDLTDYVIDNYDGYETLHQRVDIY